MSDSKPSLSTVRRSLNLLRHLEGSEVALTLTELAVLEGVTPSTALRCLRTLEEGDFVARDERKCYSPLTGGDRQVGLAAGVKILDFVAACAPQGCTLSNLVEVLGLAEVQVREALDVLVANGMLAREPAGDSWRISGGMIRFLRPVTSDRLLSGTIRPLMEELLTVWRETISWLVPVGDEQAVVDVLPSPHSVRNVLDVGARFPCYVGSAGKAQLSTLSDQALQLYLANMHPQQLTDFRPDAVRLGEELQKVRSCGYAVSMGERVEGAASVAAPVVFSADKLEGVISITMPQFRTDASRLEEIGRDLVTRVRGLYGA